MHRSHRLLRFAALIATIAVVAACGSSGTAPTAASGGGATAAPGSTAAPVGGQPSAAPTDLGFPFNFSAAPEPTWPPVGGAVRVVNLYDPGTEPPFAIDVRQSGFLTTSNPIATVEPGQTSDFFDPGDSGDGSAQLAFYRAGSSKQIDSVMEQGWNNMKGRRITLVLFTAYDNAVPAGQRNFGADYVVEEQNGTNPLPSVAPGQGLLWVDTQPIESLARDAQWPQPVLSLGDGKCLADDNDKANGNGFSFLGGRNPYSLPAGAVKVSVYGNVEHDTECTGAPDFGPIDATVAAGQITWLIISGPDLKHLKTTTLTIKP